MRSSDAPSSGHSSGAWAFVLVMVCLSAAAMLSAALRSGDIDGAQGASAPANGVAAESLVASVPVQLPAQPVNMGLPSPRPKQPVEKADLAKQADAAPTVRPAASEPVAIERAPFERAPLEPAARVFADTPAASTLAISAASQAPSVTITGCLELDDETFRLKNTSGADAPKARSWKSGFLRKSAATIEVVDAGKSLALPTHVGRRVAVTGTLVDREMKARTVRTLASSCDRSA